MINEKVEKFLEANDIAYMFCLLANKEVERMNQLPQSIRDAFNRPITEEAIEHIAKNHIPDYMFESNEAMIAARDEDLDMNVDDEEDIESLMGSVD